MAHNTEERREIVLGTWCVRDRGSAILLLIPPEHCWPWEAYRWTGGKSTMFLAVGHLLEESRLSPTTLSHKAALPNP